MSTNIETIYKAILEGRTEEVDDEDLMMQARKDDQQVNQATADTRSREALLYGDDSYCRAILPISAIQYAAICDCVETLHKCIQLLQANKELYSDNKFFGGYGFFDEYPLFHLCAIKGSKKCLKLLMDTYPLIVHSENMFGLTALHVMSKELTVKNPGNIEIIRLLLTHGTLINAKEACGFTPLHFACSQNLQEIVTYLLEQGAEVDAFANNGETPLFDACLNGHFEVVKILLNYNCRVNIMNNVRQTPLHAACMTANISLDVIKTLVYNGASINAKNLEGETAPQILDQLLRQCEKEQTTRCKQAQKVIKQRPVSASQRRRRRNRKAKSKSAPAEMQLKEQNANLIQQHLLQHIEDICKQGLACFQEKLNELEYLAGLKNQLEVLLNTKFSEEATRIQDFYIDHTIHPAQIVVNTSKGSLYKVQQVLQQVSEDLHRFCPVERDDEIYYLSDITDPLNFLRDMKNQLTVFLNCNFRTQNTGIESFYVDEEAEQPRLIIDVTKGKTMTAEDVINKFIWQQNHIALMNCYTIVEQDNEFEYCSWEPGRAMGVETQGPIQAGRIGSPATSGESNFILSSCHLINRTHTVSQGEVIVHLPAGHFAGPVPTTYCGVIGISTTQPVDWTIPHPAVDIAAIMIPDSPDAYIPHYPCVSIYESAPENLPSLTGQTLHMERFEGLLRQSLQCFIHNADVSMHNWNGEHFYTNQVLSVMQPNDAHNPIIPGDSGSLLFIKYDNEERQGVAMVNRCRGNSRIVHKGKEIIVHQLYAVYIDNCLNSMRQCHRLELSITPNQLPNVEPAEH